MVEEHDVDESIDLWIKVTGHRFRENRWWETCCSLRWSVVVTWPVPMRPHSNLAKKTERTWLQCHALKGRERANCTSVDHLAVVDEWRVCVLWTPAFARYRYCVRRRHEAELSWYARQTLDHTIAFNEGSKRMGGGNVNGAVNGEGDGSGGGDANQVAAVGRHSYPIRS